MTDGVESFHTLFGYTVLRDKDEQDTPYVIARIEVRAKDMPGKATQHIEPIISHGSYNIARYWATMLNEGKETEESVKRKITESQQAGSRGR